MITKRDREILIWIEKYKSITINQCAKIFFTRNKYAYDQARKRLQHLHKEKLLNRYRKNPQSEAIYFMEHKLKIHNLKVFDVVAEFISCNFKIEKIETEYKIYANFNNYIVDAKIQFSKFGIYGNIYLEIDYTHFTNKEKIKDIANIIKKEKKKNMIMIIKINAIEPEITQINEKVTLMVLPWDLQFLHKVLLPAVQ